MMDGGVWMWGHSGGGWLAMGVLAVLFWAVIIAAVALAIRYLMTSSQLPAPTGRRLGAEDVLADRYARGDIDDEEYRRRLALLREHRGSSRSDLNAEEAK